jgi:molecular chaperone Hsp33
VGKKVQTIQEYQLTDRIVRGYTDNGYIRFFGIDSTETVKYASEIHNLSTTNTVLFGRLISAALIMAADLKTDKGSVSIRLNSDGVGGGTVVTATNDGKVRGFMPDGSSETPLNETTKQFDVKKAVGNGTLQITKDLGMKNTFTGTVDLLYGEIGTDLTYYYAKSEQTPSSIGLGVLIFPEIGVKTAGGFMVQLMPDTPEEVITKLETNLKHFPNLTDMLDMGHSIEELILDHILKGFDAEIKETTEVSYHCGCSSQNIYEKLRLLPKEDLDGVIEEQGKVTTVCHFCNTNYVFTKEEIEMLHSL